MDKKTQTLSAMYTPGAILLISCYELGHRPIGLTRPLAALENAGFSPDSIDIAVETLDEEKVKRAHFIGISVPMHTALRLGVHLHQRIRELNSDVTICMYGLYAKLNADYLLSNGVDYCVSGEVFTQLVTLVESLAEKQQIDQDTINNRKLPDLEKYAHFEDNGEVRVVGYTDLEKHHTRADVETAIDIVHSAGITLRPTWVPFTPWTTLDDYLEILEFVDTHRLVYHVDPVQYAVRLLIPPGSYLLNRPETKALSLTLDQTAFSYIWAHPDARMDELHKTVNALVQNDARIGVGMLETFYQIWELAADMQSRRHTPLCRNKKQTHLPAPRITEAWFC